MVGPDGHVGVLPPAPVAGGPFPHRRVRVGQQPGVGVGQVAVPVGRRDPVAEAGPLLGEQPPHLAGDPVDLVAAGGGHRDQDHLGHPLGVPLGIGQAQGGAPGAAEHQPPLDPEVAAELLDVAQQVVGGVDRQVGGRVAGVGAAAPAAPLVEQDHPVGVGVEDPPHPRRAARPRAAVEHHRRLALGVAAHLPVDELAVADLQHALIVGLDLGVAPRHDNPLPPATPGTGQRPVQRYRGLRKGARS